MAQKTQWLTPATGIRAEENREKRKAQKIIIQKHHIYIF
jgi:hypothetical protein